MLVVMDFKKCFLTPKILTEFLANKTNIDKLRDELFQSRENAELQKEILDEIHTLKEDPPAWA